MKRLTIMLAAAAALLPMASHATYMEAPAMDDPEIIVPDSTGFKFTDIKLVKTTPVKDQNKSGTCWCFSGLSALEEDVMRKGGPELDLSEMYLVRQNYIDKARKYIRTDGQINFAQGGSFADVFEAAKEYGVMPEEAYAGLEYGEKKHSHYEMAEALAAYLDAIRKNPNKKLSDSWLNGFIGILDAYLGKVPEDFHIQWQDLYPEGICQGHGGGSRGFRVVHKLHAPSLLSALRNGTGRQLALGAEHECADG